MRLDTILVNLDDEERETLLAKILDELTLGEITDALTYLWDRRAPDTQQTRGRLTLGLTVGERCAIAVAAYQDEVARLDAEIAAAEDES